MTLIVSVITAVLDSGDEKTFTYYDAVNRANADISKLRDKGTIAGWQPVTRDDPSLLEPVNIPIASLSMLTTEYVDADVYDSVAAARDAAVDVNETLQRRVEVANAFITHILSCSNEALGLPCKTADDLLKAYAPNLDWFARPQAIIVQTVTKEVEVQRFVDVQRAELGNDVS